MATVVITGASMGIGRALALAWARRGDTVVLSARSERALEDVAAEAKTIGGRAIVVPGDVTSGAHRRALIEHAVQTTGGIDVLVNNAGRGYYAPFHEVDLDTMRGLFELNVFAPLELAQLAKPHLERARGAIVMLSSVAGVVAAPRYAAYSASKFALEAMSMAMRSELHARGVRVIVVRPGPVATPFRENSHRGAEGGYTKPDPKAQSAEAVAERTLRAVDRGSDVDETSAFVRFASIVSRHAPPAMRFALRRMALRPPED
ncbi:MAG: SDR family NAD(P)-dependent oxidoreductase [Polyangiaceae bacterium]